MGTISGWTEAILLTIAFVSVFGVIVASLNISYNKNNNFDLTDDSGSEQLFIQYQDTAEQQIKGGEVEFSASEGITLKSSYGIAKDAISIVWTFLSGGFIEKVVSKWGIGESGTIIALSLRIIYFLSLVFALLYALFKIVI